MIGPKGPMALSSFYDAWPVSGSRFPVLCPAWPDHNPANKRAQSSSLRHVACAWLAPPVLKVPLMGGYLHLRRRRQRRCCRARTASRINLRSGFAEKFAETGLLASSKAVSMSWPDLV